MPPLPDNAAWSWSMPRQGELAVLSLQLSTPLESATAIRSWPQLLLPATTVQSLLLTDSASTVESWPVASEPLIVHSFTFQPPANKPRSKQTEQPPESSHTTPNIAQSIELVSADQSPLIPLPELPDSEESLNDDVTNSGELPLETLAQIPSAKPIKLGADSPLAQLFDPSQPLEPLVSEPPAPIKYTWVKPPESLIKLEDRLFYLLQPALETLLVEQDLHFPFHPFPYQFEGIAFLFPRAAALLADEMGLGKTMQAITSIRLLVHAGDVSNVLLVCPKPLVSNWVREFQLWAPELPIAVIEGDASKRRWQWENVECPVKIANYESVCRDKELVCDGAQRFDLMVLDESQRIKNRSSSTAQVVRSIQRTRSWALTGTPVENSPEDLVGIFEFVAPGQLTAGMKPKAMGKAAGDYILRRTKDAVLTEMPPKLFRDAHVELNPQQHAAYRMAEDEGVLQLNDLGESATIQHVFELVLRLKQICNFDPTTSSSSKVERLEADLEEIVASGHKAILFSQWVNTLGKLKQRLKRFGVMEYHGKIPHREREGVIQQFKDDPNKHIILMSYGAGSVGLNLQFCRYVFLFDRWWNPAVEDQAINRAHRIGVAGTVTVTRFVTLNTIEERINQVLEEKRALFDTILGNAEANESLGLSASEIFGLFKLKCPSGPIRYAA